MQFDLLLKLIMKLYYFTKSRYGLEAIRDKRLKIARINELNDPFEFLSLSLPREERISLRNWKESMHHQYGLICMSREWQHPLLWAHYADSHRGMCLGFDVMDDDTFCKVNYLSRRKTLKDFGYSSISKITKLDMKKLLFSKFNVWSYESEYRNFCTLGEKEKGTSHYFLPFSENMKLSAVIIGERSAISREEIVNSLAGNENDIVTFKARCAFRDFKIVRNLKKSAWK